MILTSIRKRNIGYVLVDRKKGVYLNNVVGTESVSGDKFMVVKSFSEAHIFQSKVNARFIKNSLIDGSRFSLEKVHLVDFSGD